MKTVSKTSASAEQARFAALAARFGGARVDASCGIVWVSVARQELVLVAPDGTQVSYPVSTSRHGTGCRQDSYRTPLGLHRIEEMIGAGAAPGTVFKGRRAQPAGYDAGDGDPVTTRILWLRGLQPGINDGLGCDTHARYIYIHGTPHEADLGRPASAGCVRMRAADVIDLFDRVRQGTPVLLEA